MNIGSKVTFSFRIGQSAPQRASMILSRNMLAETELSDSEVIARLTSKLQSLPQETLIKNGYILAARNLLKMYPNALSICVAEESEKRTQGGDNAAGGILFLAFVAILVAVICFPLLVMLGMRGKLFLKGFYNHIKNPDYKKFAKSYMYLGIGLYAVVVALIAVDRILELFVLSGPAFGLLFVGGIAYFVLSLVLVRKKFPDEEHPKNIIGTIKSSFKKKENK